MRYTFKKEYYKRRRPGEEPISFHASQKGNRVKATIKMDPVLKKHPDLRKALLAHETIVRLKRGLLETQQLIVKLGLRNLWRYGILVEFLVFGAK